MKTFRIVLFILSFFIFAACTPVGTSESLLSAGSNSTTPTTTGEEVGELEIRPDNQELSVSVDDNDKVEISGSCADLNRKKNRILVEVFSGEDENVNPYISNAISDNCLAAQGAFTGNGTIVGVRCFWVSQGLGLVEELGLPSQRSFPQCHNGRFSFSVRLGAVMTTPAPSGSRYTVRFKMRTQEGAISESPWSRVYVTRKLNIPSIDKIVPNDNEYSCTLEMSPARFNQNIKYDLSRTWVGGPVSGSHVTLFNGPPPSGRISSLSIVPGVSAYNFVSNGLTAQHRIIAGVTYTYTLNALEDTDYSTNGGFSYSTPLQENSAPKSCTISPHSLEPTPGTTPTNVPVGIGGSGPTCYFRFRGAGDPGARPGHPALGSAVTLQWGFSTVSNWTGINKDGVPPFSAPNCTTSIFCNPSLGNGGLQANTTYHFAVREISNDGQIGKWSQEISCTPPAPQN